MRVGDSLVVGAPDPQRPTVLLVGHLDTVPPTDDDMPPRESTLDDGTAVVIARGASDMKSGNVVAMHLMEDVELRAASPWSLALLLYAGEEGPADGNELRAVLDAVPWLTDAVLAVVLEPTDGRVELGCLGGIHARVTFMGAAAHSARPWHGRNALAAAGAFLAALEARAPVDTRRRRHRLPRRAGPDAGLDRWTRSRRAGPSAAQRRPGPLHREREPALRTLARPRGRRRRSCVRGRRRSPAPMPSSTSRSSTVHRPRRRTATTRSSPRS
jgi:acetylornithine deacetylase/succinyl-diaminopimelate desuccinylase-like protein